MKHHTELPIQLAPPHRVKTYDQAWLYCLLLDYEGYKDWRMPALDEWRVSFDSDIKNASYCEELTNTYYTKTCVSPVRDMLELAPLSEEMTYDEALWYCLWLEYDGKKGWRLPTIKEWANTKGIPVYSWRQNEHRKMFDTMPVVPVRGHL